MLRHLKPVSLLAHEKYQLVQQNQDSELKTELTQKCIECMNGNRENIDDRMEESIKVEVDYETEEEKKSANGK